MHSVYNSTLPQVSISVGTLLLLFSAVYCLLIAYIEEAFALYLTENEVELGMLSGQSPDLSESKLAFFQAKKKFFCHE